MPTSARYGGLGDVLDAPLDILGSDLLTIVPIGIVAQCEGQRLATGDEAYRLSLRVGQFALLYPGEGHMPKLVCGIPSHVDKIVVKIAIK